MSETDRWAVSEHLHALLLDAYGYELVNEVLWDFSKVLDAQHATVVRASRLSGDRSAYLQLGYARRDINELVRELQGAQAQPWKRTVEFTFDESEAPLPQFLGNPKMPLMSTPDAATDWMARWLPELESRASLDMIVSELRVQIDEAPPDRVDVRRRGRLLPLMANQMLSGWRGVVDEQEYFTQLERWAAEGGTTQAMYGRWLDNAVAWIAEHPDGVDRELAD